MNIEQVSNEILDNLHPGDWSANKAHVRAVLQRYFPQQAGASATACAVMAYPATGSGSVAMPGLAVAVQSSELQLKGTATLTMNPQDMFQTRTA